MKAITRKPKLLVKMSAAPQRLTLAAGRSKIGVEVKPLFQSIKDKKVGLAAAPQWQVVTATDETDEVNSWDLCHQMMTGDVGFARGTVQFAEPDLEQRWIFGTESQSLLAATNSCDRAQSPDSRLPVGEGLFWFRDQAHSQLQAAREEVGQPSSRVCIAHFDTGYDPNHVTRPQFIRDELQRNFEDGSPNDATDHSEGVFNNLGHGAGTLGILAGAVVDGSPLGGAAFLDVIPIRVANSVVLFQNSSIAKAFDHVHSLSKNANTRVHVITMSMGGLASQAWADAVNALYELGVFIVTAAGNNFGNFPTRNIVYPARFKRVIAACGVMADGRPYADLPINIMAGNYGPESKMPTAMAAYTPNIPWPRMGCNQLVDRDGRGTSAATPQIAAAAALWIQKFKSQWEGYSQGWMRVEAVRKALADSANLASPALSERLGRGVIRAQAALAQKPAKEASLRKQEKDSVRFPFLRVITGLGLKASDARQQMLELEALQLIQQSKELEQLMPDPDLEKPDLSETDRKTFTEALFSTPGASRTLREALGNKVRRSKSQTTVPPYFKDGQENNLKHALEPTVKAPATRPLRVFAFDPLAATKVETMNLNEITIEVGWEDLLPGPVGDYFEVVDVDPPAGVAYAPVDLNNPALLTQGGLPPSAANPQFHQQMVYAVAMKTLGHFERALGRVALWPPAIRFTKDGVEAQFVRRLRIYPHALQEANAYYSPSKAALLFGYFRASDTSPGGNLPGQPVFTCLSHDIVAHETTHALLDGLHERFREPTNKDVLAFHEAFADIVALFQHFTVPEALRDQIARTRGDLTKQNLLGELAQQFGQSLGAHGALRDALGFYDVDGSWKPRVPSSSDYGNASEPHDLGAVLVAAVFDAFLTIYRRRSAEVIKLATGGTNLLPPGDIQRDLVDWLAREASKTASHVLNMCIRALDYCPPLDLTFGEYVRALITADRDLVADDDRGYRLAFMQAFRRRGIYPENVRDLTTESVSWEPPELDIPIQEFLGVKSLDWNLNSSRVSAYQSSRRSAAIFHHFLTEKINYEQARYLGILPPGTELTVENMKGRISRVEVHSVRPLRRVGPDGQLQVDLVIVIAQSWRPENGGAKYRGGSTIIIGQDEKKVRYVIRKRVGHAGRIFAERTFGLALADSSLRSNYYEDILRSREPFALLHRGF